jgi:8-oxo-dGTP pyrophosphatase MutT (NUDIX family)
VALLGELYRKLARTPERARVAAAVPVRRRATGALEFLLVRTSNGARWTFPKGRREAGEALAQTAAREAAEEGGVSGRIGGEPLAHYRYPSPRGGDDLVTAFLLQVEHEGMPTELNRDPSWFGFEAARSKLAERRPPAYGEQMERVLLAADRAARQDR